MLRSTLRGYAPPWRHPSAARQALDGVVWMEEADEDFAARVLAAHVLRRLACWRSRGRRTRRQR